MEYIEKDYKLKPDDEFATSEEEKIDYEDFKRKMENNIAELRESMGGESRDITTREISSTEEIIEGFKDKVKIRIYSPETNNPKPLMIFCHGGGFFGGSLEAVEEHCKGVADRADVVVISVDYHLAPEFPFPVGIEDCYKALNYGIENADRLKIDKDNVIIAGDSAGGNFAAVLSMMARDRGKNNISKQILLYPVTTFAQKNNQGVDPEVTMFDEVMRDWYLGSNVNKENPYVSPLVSDDLTNLPEALVVVCEFDGLKKQGLEYAKALDRADNQVKCIQYKNTAHAFIDNTGYSQQAADLVDEIAEFVHD